MFVLDTWWLPGCLNPAQHLLTNPSYLAASVGLICRRLPNTTASTILNKHEISNNLIRSLTYLMVLEWRAKMLYSILRSTASSWATWWDATLDPLKHHQIFRNQKFLVEISQVCSRKLAVVQDKIRNVRKTLFKGYPFQLYYSNYLLQFVGRWNHQLQEPWVSDP